jgi:hypothetical protein
LHECFSHAAAQWRNESNAEKALASRCAAAPLRENFF